MPKRLDLTGQRFGRLIAERLRPSKNGKACWECSCDCGATTVVRSGCLRSGKIQSCGCRRVPSGIFARKHGKSGTAEHRIWKGMRSRCNIPTHPSYKDYGGRGIEVCKRWDDFNNFLADMGPRPSPSHSVDRIDNNQGYSPDNCRWASAHEQTRNKRTNVFVRVGNERMILSDALKAVGIKRVTYKNRRHLGWGIEEAVFTPVTKRRSK